VDVLKLLSQSLRGAIVAPPGKHLFVADYASIEARVLLWCAQDDAGLEMFRRGTDMYCDMASAIYGRHIAPNPDAQPPERELGKIAILGLGYQMGAPKFHATCASKGIVITEELAQKTVEAYRAKYARVKQLWYDQETAAGEATYDKEGTEYECFPVKWVKSGRFLYCILPSGRQLAYPDPAIKVITTSWGARKNALTYMGVNATTRKWHRQSSYGGLLVENIVQAISRDIMAEAMLRCEESRIYSPILSIHDEIVCEANEHLGDVEEFEKLVGQCPDWCAGCPVTAESWAENRYRK
jgi:DNA polymerase